MKGAKAAKRQSISKDGFDTTGRKRMRIIYQDPFASFLETMPSKRKEQIKSAGQDLGYEVTEEAEEDEDEDVIHHHEESRRPVSPVRVRIITPLLVCFLSIHLRLTLRRVLSLSPSTPIYMEAAAGGGTLSELYQNARRLLLRTRDALEKLERLDSSSFSSSSSYSSSLPSSASTAGVGLDPADLSFSIKRDVTQIQSLCAEMDRLSRSIGAKGQRDLWKRKVEQVAEEADSLRESLEKHALRQQKKVQEAKERADLLGRASGDSEHILKIFDDEAQAMQSARNSHMMLEEAYATGVAVLSKYADQRDRLKRAQRKALDVLNTVGLSNSVLKLIERRHRVDKWIAYTGMMITVVVMYMFWRWTH